jgi:aquaporin Z
MGIPMSSDAASHWMNTVTIPARSAVASRAAVAGRKYVVELIGTFFLVFTVAPAYSSGPRWHRWRSVRP